MNSSELSIERLTTYSYEDAVGIGRLMPYLSQRLDCEPIPESLLTDIIRSPFHDQLVARLDSIIVGSATLSLLMGPAASRVGYLEDFVTDPSVRGQGIGGRMWQEIMEWCTEHGANLEFTSSPSRTDAHRFYTARGATIRDTTVFHVDI